MDIVIIYGSLEGQTKKIVERIAAILHDKGHEVTSLSSEQLPSDLPLNDFDAAIIGGPIPMGKFPKQLSSFVSAQKDWLNKIPSAFFTVCMAINSKLPKSREQALQYGENFLRQSCWQPTLTEVFAGAVKYTQYDFITRFIMKMISKREGGSTDTSRDHEYTDWNKVTQFAEAFIAVISDQQSRQANRN